MAVELRCPDCRAKLRLPEAPEAGTEVECPKCGSVFAAPEKASRPPADEDKPARKKDRDADGDKPAKKSEKAKGEGKAEKKGGKVAAEGGTPKKRKWRTKQKTNPKLMWGIIAGGVLFVGSFAGALIWFFTKKSVSQEMMLYLPDDTDEVFGLNIGHLQKYPEFYKTCQVVYSGTGFRKVGDAFAKALGKEQMDDVVEYVVQGTGAVGGKAGGQTLEATVFRTKVEYDPGLLAKLPGAQKYNSGGVDYYTVDDPGLGYPGMRAFGPTGRLVVFCRGDMPDAKFKAMLNGNKDNPDATIVARAAPLIRQVSRGTAWSFAVYGRSVAKFNGESKAGPPGAAQGGRPTGPTVAGVQETSPEAQLNQEIAGILSGAKGSGVKASVGSREVRGEWIVWLGEGDAASQMAKKWREKEWVKDSELDMPRWFKSLAVRSGAGKTAENVVRDGLAFKSAGETFIVRTSVETKLIQGGGVGGIVSGVTGRQQNNMGPPGGGGGPPGAPGPPGGQPGVGGPRQRRRYLVRPRR